MPPNRSNKQKGAGNKNKDSHKRKRQRSYSPSSRSDASSAYLSAGDDYYDGMHYDLEDAGFDGFEEDDRMHYQQAMLMRGGVVGRGAGRGRGRGARQQHRGGSAGMGFSDYLYGSGDPFDALGRETNRGGGRGKGGGKGRGGRDTVAAPQAAAQQQGAGAKLHEGGGKKNNKRGFRAEAPTAQLSSLNMAPTPPNANPSEVPFVQRLLQQQQPSTAAVTEFGTAMNAAMAAARGVLRDRTEQAPATASAAAVGVPPQTRRTVATNGTSPAAVGPASTAASLAATTTALHTTQSPSVMSSLIAGAASNASSPSSSAASMLDVADSNGDTPLHYKIKMIINMPSVAAAARRAGGGADGGGRTNGTAVALKKEEDVTEMKEVKVKAEPTTSHEDYQTAAAATPSIRARIEEEFANIGLLVEAGANINLRNKQGMTPLMLVCDAIVSVRALLLLQGRSLQGATSGSGTSDGSRAAQRVLMLHQQHTLTECGGDLMIALAEYLAQHPNLDADATYPTCIVESSSSTSADGAITAGDDDKSPIAILFALFGRGNTIFPLLSSSGSELQLLPPLFFASSWDSSVFVNLVLRMRRRFDSQLFLLILERVMDDEPLPSGAGQMPPHLLRQFGTHNDSQQQRQPFASPFDACLAHMITLPGCDLWKRQVPLKLDRIRQAILGDADEDDPSMKTSIVVDTGVFPTQAVSSSAPPMNYFSNNTNRATTATSAFGAGFTPFSASQQQQSHTAQHKRPSLPLFSIIEYVYMRAADSKLYSRVFAPLRDAEGRLLCNTKSDVARLAMDASFALEEALLSGVIPAVKAAIEHGALLNTTFTFGGRRIRPFDINRRPTRFYEAHRRRILRLEGLQPLTPTGGILTAHPLVRFASVLEIAANGQFSTQSVNTALLTMLLDAGADIEGRSIRISEGGEQSSLPTGAASDPLYPFDSDDAIMAVTPDISGDRNYAMNFAPPPPPLRSIPIIAVVTRCNFSAVKVLMSRGANRRWDAACGRDGVCNSPIPSPAEVALHDDRSTELILLLIQLGGRPTASRFLSKCGDRVHQEVFAMLGRNFFA